MDIHVDRGECRLVSRNGHTFRSWPSLCTHVAKVLRAESAVLDGEITCLDTDGRPNFNALLFRRVEPVMYAFDLLALDGKDLRDQPLMQRKKMLRRILPRVREPDSLREDARGASPLIYLDHVVGRGIDLFAAVCEMDAEGIVAKRLDGIYDPNVTTWIKVKNRDYTQARDRHELFEGRRTAGAGRR